MNEKNTSNSKLIGFFSILSAIYRGEKKAHMNFDGLSIRISNLRNLIEVCAKAIESEGIFPVSEVLKKVALNELIEMEKILVKLQEKEMQNDRDYSIQGSQQKLLNGHTLYKSAEVG
jgi:hypothetical protein